MYKVKLYKKTITSVIESKVLRYFLFGYSLNYLFVSFLVNFFKKKTITITTYSALNVPTLILDKRYFIVCKNGLHVDSLLKTAFLSIFKNLISISIFFLDKFTVVSITKKFTENIWSVLGVLNSSKKTVTNIFRYFWYSLFCLFVFILLI